MFKRSYAYFQTQINQIFGNRRGLIELLLKIMLGLNIESAKVELFRIIN